MEYKFIGEKGSRKVIKTIEIREESYKALKEMLESGKNMTDNIYPTLLEDTYHIFGGNCYGMLVSLAVENLIGNIVHELEEKKYLSVEGNVAFSKMTDTLFPSMVYTKDNDGAVDDELRFFEVDVDDIINGVASCLVAGPKDIFTHNLNEAIKSDGRPAGEIAIGILLYISSEVSVGTEAEVAN